ncbi:MAG: hypothetical protein R3Y28_03955 [Candidatus Gastranaerophilales bacterium]
MAQQFNSQNIKKRQSVLVFLKSSSTPVVMYVENPEELYTELQQAMKNPVATIIEREMQGALKKISFVSTQIASIAIQEEQYVPNQNR